VLVAVGDALRETPLGFVEPPLTAVKGMQIRVGAARLCLQAPGNRDLHRPVHRGSPVSALSSGGTALGVERVTEYLGHVERFGQCLCPPRQPDRGVDLPVFQPKAGEPGVRPGQLGAGPERLQDHDRGLGRGRRFMAAARSPLRMGKLGESGAFAHLVTGPAPQHERMLTSVGGVLPSVEQSRFVGEPVPQTGGRRRGCPGREPQGPPELRRRLSV